MCGVFAGCVIVHSSYQQSILASKCASGPISDEMISHNYAAGFNVRFAVIYMFDCCGEAMIAEHKHKQLSICDSCLFSMLALGCMPAWQDLVCVKTSA